MKKIIVLLSFIVIACAAVVYFAKEEPVDGISAATHHVSDKKITLPEKSDTYNAFLVEGLNKFTVKYSSDFYRGGTIKSVEGIKALKDKGIDTIISITPDDKERSLVKHYGMKLIELEFETKSFSKKHIDQFVNAVKGAKCVYVHCHGGTHRAGALGMVYRLASEGWSYEKAREEFVRLGGYPLQDRPMLEVIKKWFGDK